MYSRRCDLIENSCARAHCSLSPHSLLTPLLPLFFPHLVFMMSHKRQLLTGSLTTTSASLCYHLPRVYQLNIRTRIWHNHLYSCMICRYIPTGVWVFSQVWTIWIWAAPPSWVIWYVCSSHQTALSTRRHPAHPVLVPILPPRVIQTLWSKNHDTEILLIQRILSYFSPLELAFAFCPSAFSIKCFFIYFSYM